MFLENTIKNYGMVSLFNTKIFVLHLFAKPHNPEGQHIHVVFAEYKLSMSLTGEILAGKELPKKKQKLLEAWVANREDELLASWIALNDNGELTDEDINII